MIDLKTALAKSPAGLSADRAQLLNLLLERRSREARSIRRRPTDRLGKTIQLPTSWAQRRLWFIDQLEGGSRAYRITATVRVRGSLNHDALCSALNRIVQRHEALRTTFSSVDGGPKQEIADDGRFALEMIDLRDAATAQREPQARGCLLDELRRTFDLRTGPLIRGLLLQVRDDEHVLMLTMHHIVSDGWSMGVLFRELTQLYEAYSQGRNDPLLPLPVQYADYAHWQREWLQGDLSSTQLDYWRTRLAGAAELLELPTDRPRSATRNYRGETLSVELDEQLTAKLKHFAQQQEITLFMLLYAGWATLLSWLSGQEDVLVGTPVANRQRPEIEELIGFFVNSLVLRVEVRGDLLVREFLKRVKEVTLGAYDHQDIPFEQVVEAVQPQRNLNRNPLFQVMLALQNTPSSQLHLSGLNTTQEGELDEPAMFDLLLSFEEREGRLVGAVNYAAELFDRTTIERWMSCFKVLLRELISRPLARLDQLQILPHAERQQVIERFNRTRTPFAHQELLHERFEAQVERSPEAVAVAHESSPLTFSKLNARANQLARFLRSKGVGPDQLVALCVERDPEMIVGLLGIWKAGGGYVPLDPQYPTERLAHMLDDAAPRVLLTQERLKARLPDTTAEVITLDQHWSEIDLHCNTNLDARAVGLRSDHLAYVIYTSGSTGKPKGVMVEHRHVMSLLHGLEPLYQQCAPCQRVGVNASITFDASVKQLIQLLVGRSLVLVPQALRLDPSALISFVRSQRIDAIDCTPSQLHAWISAGLLDQPESAPRLVLTGGEAVDPALWTRLARSTRPRFFNLYGPTESTVDATATALYGEQSTPHIGRPLGNRQIYLLDRASRPVPIGVTAEVCIGGAGVARGYLHRPGLTAARFCPDPFSPEPLARLYKSGDLGRWRTDGTIEYLGRTDHQVKVRGYRIELGEIEARLVHHETVEEAVVVAREDLPGEKRLVAYVTTHGGITPDAETLHAYLSASLPEHMLPAAFVTLGRMPLTPNGKLDRRALPAPEADAYRTRHYEAPQGEIEQILANIWQQLLHVERVGRQDNFFELGGHSLMIMQMLEQLRQVSLSGKVAAVFEHPTLSGFASGLTSATGILDVPANLISQECAVITPQMLPLVTLDADHIERIVCSVPGGVSNIQDIYPLAPLQEGILFHHLLDRDRRDPYLLSTLLSVSSRERLDELVAAIQAVINRHDILRTAVLWEKLPSPVQVVYRQASLRVNLIELRPGENPIAQLRQRMESVRADFDLRSAPLIKLQVAADPRSASWYALLQWHHITSDHITRDAILSEVVAYLEGRADALPQAAPYRNHVAQVQQYARAHDAADFFRGKLADVDEPTAPFGLLDVHGTESLDEGASEQLELSWARRLRIQCRQLGVTPAALFHTAWALVTAGTTGRDDVVFGTVLLGRLQGTAGAQRTLGMFINTLPVRIRLQGSCRQTLLQMQRELVELLVYEQASLADAQRCSGIGGSTPLFSALFNYRHSMSAPDANWTSAAGIDVLAESERTNYPITVSVDDLGEAFTLWVHADQRANSQRVLGYLSMAVRSLVQALEESPHTPALKLPILPALERQTVVEQFNATEADYPRELMVHQLFEAQAHRTPNATAVEYGQGRQLTYAQLDAAANQLARHLRARNVGPDQIVGVCFPRGFEMVIGLLATLKAGGAYLPLDPNYPADRLALMLEDASPRVVLAQRESAASLPATSAEIILLEDTLPQLAQSVQNALPEVERNSKQLLYVIYTSGSTGRPKGTTMAHASMINLLEWHRRHLSAGRRVLQFAALSFDVAFQEIFSTLCTGGTLVMIDEWVRRDARALATFLGERSIERLFVPPLMLQNLAEHYSAATALPSRLQDVITAGEQLRISPQIASFFERLRDCRLHNHYGPTETHVVTALTLTGKPAEWPTLPPIGRPIANTQIYVLNAQKQPVPIGVAGEIFIGGANVGRGYLNHPELVAQRFGANPFGGETDARMYKTGDLGRWHADGTIEYLGRNDDQVKIRGYRIELGEIEAHLVRHPQIREAAVLAAEDQHRQKRLIAYVVSSSSDVPSSEALRAYTKAALPEYMVPSAFVTLERLPLTPSGKLNRRALPHPEQSAYATHEYAEPQGGIEQALAEIWQELLHVERVGRNDSFFDLGGHSLLATRLASRIGHLLEVDLPLRVIFDAPTLEGLAQHIAREIVTELSMEEI